MYFYSILGGKTKIKDLAKAGFGKHYLIKSASIISFGRGLGVAAGIVLDALILAYFGIGKETDAFFSALAIPLLISGIFQIQIPKVLVPIFTKSLKEDGQFKTSSLVCNLIHSCIVLLSLGSLLYMVIARFLIPIQIPGLSAEVVSLSINLSLYLIWLVLLSGIGSILRSVFYMRHKYLLPSLTKVISSIITIIMIIMFSKQYGIQALVFGFMLGNTAQLIVLMCGMVRGGVRYRFVCKLNDKKLQQVIKLFFYPFITHGIHESRVLFENFLASFFPVGSLSILRYANRIIAAMLGILTGGIATSTLSPVSHFVAEKRIDEMKECILKGIKMLVFLVCPVSVWLIFTCNQMLILFFARGKFTSTDAITLSIVITIMAPSILFGRISGILQIPFYADFDVRTPLLTTIIFFFSYAVGVFSLVKIFEVYGFPIAFCLGNLLSAICISVFFKNKFGALGWWKLKNFMLRFSGVLIFIVFGLILGLYINTFLEIAGLNNSMMNFTIPTFLGLFAFLMASILLGLIDYRLFSNFLKKKLQHWWFFRILPPQ